MKFTSYFVQILLWLSIAASPTLTGALIGLFINQSLGDINALALPLCSFIGFIIGAFWAENIRKTTGLSNFLGMLMNNKELNKINIKNN